MKILQNKKGASLPFVLGVLLFIVSSSIILITSVITNSIQIENDYKRTESYMNAQNLVKATAEIIARDKDFTTDYLDSLATHMNVEITSTSDDILYISKGVSDKINVSSYLKTVTSDSATYDLYDSFLDYDGLESNFEKDPFLTPSVMLSSYLNEFLNDTFSSGTYNQNLTDFDSIFSFIETLAEAGDTYTVESPNILKNQNNPTVYGHWYIDGNLVLGNDDDLTIPDGYLLFIDGDLTMKKRSTIYGNVVVNGNVKIDSNATSASLNGTVYASGNFTAERYFDLGTFWEPSFIVIDGKFKVQRYMEGYGYIFATEVQVNKNRTIIDVEGGVYADKITNLDSSEINNNYWSSYIGVEGTAIPEQIIVSSGDSSSGGSIIYTNPS